MARYKPKRHIRAVTDTDYHSAWEEGAHAASEGLSIAADPYADRDGIRSRLWLSGYSYIRTGYEYLRLVQ